MQDSKKFFFPTFFLFLLLLLPSMLMAQVKNDKALLVKNKVLSEVKKLCTTSCMTQYSQYSRRGNLIEWNFYRTASLYQYKYNVAGELVMTLIINKSNVEDIDTVLAGENYYDIEVDQVSYFEKKDKKGNLILKYSEQDSTFYTYDRNDNLIEKKRIENGEITFRNTFKYDQQQRVIEEQTLQFNKYSLEVNLGKESWLDHKINRYTYNEKGQITELYTYFMDPCIGLDGHFLYKYTYYNNGLIQGAEAFDDQGKYAFSLEYEYDFYD